MEIFLYKVTANSFPCECGIEVYRLFAYSIVVATELETNQGMSICNAFEDLLPQVVERFKLDINRLMWIERWLPDKVVRIEEEYSLVQFDIKGDRALNPRWLYL